MKLDDLLTALRDDLFLSDLLAGDPASLSLLTEAAKEWESAKHAQAAVPADPAAPVAASKGE